MDANEAKRRVDCIEQLEKYTVHHIGKIDPNFVIDDDYGRPTGLNYKHLLFDTKIGDLEKKTRKINQFFL